MKRITISPAKRRAFLRMPVVVIPGLCGLFFVLHQGIGTIPAAGGPAGGLNTQLPSAVNGRELLNKKLQYERAERDSLQKAQFERQDPYRRDSGTIVKPPVNYPGRILPPANAAAKPVMATDPRAKQVLEQLRQLQHVIRTPRPPMRPGGLTGESPAPRWRENEPADTTGDARVGQLNRMLDKVIRIQHPEEARGKPLVEETRDVILPADSSSNSILAVVADDQTLIAGATIALRIVDSIRVNGRVWPAGQLIYGTVAINNDRMLVHVGSLREDRSLYVTDLQAYDLDGIAGIHIPGVLSRDVAKQSADQGVNSLNVLNADPSLGAQAATAGIQTVKSFVGRKVKQVRVSVRAGYQVLLRDAHPKSADRGRVGSGVGMVGLAPVAPPGLVAEGRVISVCRNEGVELRLRGIWLMEGRMWFGLEWQNHSPVAFTPAYARWYIRDRRQVRRTAMQEISLEPVSTGGLSAIGADSVEHSWTGFNPFALAKGKELVLEIAEKGDGRVLELVIKHQELLKAKDYGKETGEGTDPTGDRAL